MIIIKSIKNTLKSISNNSKTTKKKPKDKFILKIEFQKSGTLIIILKNLLYRKEIHQYRLLQDKNNETRATCWKSK